MPVVSVNELFPGREGEINFTRRRTYERIFEVYTNNAADGVYVAGTGGGVLPIIGSRYPTDFPAVCISVAPKQSEEDPTRWEVTCKYDTQPVDLKDVTQPDGSTTDPGDIPENPLLRPPKWKFSYQETTEAVRYSFKHVNGVNQYVLGQPIPVAVVNSAGLPFDPPVSAEVSRPLLTVTGNLAVFPQVSMFQMHDCINTKVWKGFPALTCRCLSVEASSAVENGIPFWEVTYAVLIKWDTWIQKVLDCGFAELWQATTVTPKEYRKILDPYGQPITEPVPLDGNGKRLAPGLNPVFLQISTFRQVDFNNLIPW